MSIIYLVRHAQASFGSDNYDELSNLGCLQASTVGTYFANNGIIFDAAYAGNLQRQQKTAQLALSKQLDQQTNVVQLITDNRLNEINNDEQIEKLLPLLAAQNSRVKTLLEQDIRQSKVFQKVIEVVFNYWVSEQCPEVGIESWQSYSSKIHRVFNHIMQTQGAGKRIAVFTSGGTIATIVSYVLGLSGSQTYQFYEPVINCSMTQILYNANKCSLSNYNDFSYLVAQSTDTHNLVTYR